MFVFSGVANFCIMDNDQLCTYWSICKCVIALQNKSVQIITLMDNSFIGFLRKPTTQSFNLTYLILLR